jgi:hypothetical protein
VVLADTLLRELRTERILAGLKLLRDELLFRLDAQEVVDVIQLLVLDKQRMTAEARAVGKNDAGAIGSVISKSASILYERPRVFTATPSGTGEVPG